MGLEGLEMERRVENVCINMEVDEAHGESTG